MKLLIIPFIALFLVGCGEHYRYECQNPANKDKEECTRPVCEAYGTCYDTLNGLPPKQAEEQPPVEETPVAPAATDCNNEPKGE